LTIHDFCVFVTLFRQPTHPVRIGDERERLVTASPVMAKSWGPNWEKKITGNGLVKPPRRDKRALSTPASSEERRRTA
jgi:hypothetical protein